MRTFKLQGEEVMLATPAPFMVRDSGFVRDVVERGRKFYVKVNTGSLLLFPGNVIWARADGNWVPLSEFAETAFSQLAYLKTNSKHLEVRSARFRTKGVRLKTSWSAFQRRVKAFYEAHNSS